MPRPGSHRKVSASEIPTSFPGLGDPEVARVALATANKRMQDEILPLLSRSHPRPRMWNPLRDDLNGPSAYGMKLWLPDALAMEILRDDNLIEMTAKIVVESTITGALARPEAFVTNILGYLMNSDG